MRARARMDDEGNILRSFARGGGGEGGRGRAREGRRLDEVDGYGSARGGEGLESGRAEEDGAEDEDARDERLTGDTRW